MKLLTSVWILLVLSAIGVRGQDTEADKLKTDIYILAGVLGGICLILLIGLIVVCVMFNSLKKSMRRNSPSVPKASPYSQPPPRPESRPLGYPAQTNYDTVPAPRQSLGSSRYDFGDTRPMGGAGRNYPSTSPYGAGAAKTNPAFMNEPNRGRNDYGY